MTDYPDGAGDPKRPEPDRSDATIDSEGPSLSAIAGKYPLVLPTRDARFCIRTVVFQVGNTIFEVPRYGFEVPGTVFETMFSLPTGTDRRGVEGTSDENPIILPVDEDHFRGFLGALYPFFNHNMTSNDWLGALVLATLWIFDEIRHKAIKMLDDYVTSKDAKTAVFIAKAYHVDSWLKAAYIRLLQGPLIIEELLQTPSLDWETIARLSYAKLRAFAETATSRYYCACGLQYSTVHEVCGCRESMTRINSAVEQSFRMEPDNKSAPLPADFPSIPSIPSIKKKKKKSGLLEAT